jgi:hypothetical protein
MPVILTTPDEVETWMTAPPDEILKLQRPLSDGSLKIVARGVKEIRAGSVGARRRRARIKARSAAANAAKHPFNYWSCKKRFPQSSKRIG